LLFVEHFDVLISQNWRAFPAFPGLYLYSEIKQDHLTRWAVRMVLNMFLLVLPATLRNHSGGMSEWSGCRASPYSSPWWPLWRVGEAGILLLYHSLLNVTLQKDALMEFRENTG